MILKKYETKARTYKIDPKTTKIDKKSEVRVKKPIKTPKFAGKFYKDFWSFKTDKSSWVVPFELFWPQKKDEI